MDVRNIIQQGDVGKYYVDIKGEGVNQDAYDFSITLSWGLLGSTLQIPKSEMLKASNGRWFFMFDSSDMTGVVTAKCEYQVLDNDFSDDYGSQTDGFRSEVSIDYLCFVVTTPNIRNCKLPNVLTNSSVIYEPVGANSAVSLKEMTMAKIVEMVADYGWSGDDLDISVKIILSAAGSKCLPVVYNNNTTECLNFWISATSKYGAAYCVTPATGKARITAHASAAYSEIDSEIASAIEDWGSLEFSSYEEYTSLGLEELGMLEVLTL